MLHSKSGAPSAQPVVVPLFWIPLLLALLAVVGVHLCYAIAVYMEHIPLCNPYWDSCTSISRTGRRPPEKLVFKAFMIPVALLGLCFWLVIGDWLHRHVGVGRKLMVLGTIANICLMVYLVALGEGSGYNLARRTGVTLFFGLTLFAQLLFVYYMQRYLLPLQSDSRITRWFHWMYALAVITFGVCMVSVLLSAFYAGYNQIDDAFEWVIALLMNTHFLLHAFLWRDLGINARVD